MVKIRMNAVPNLKGQGNAEDENDLKPMIILNEINMNSIQLKKLKSKMFMFNDAKFRSTVNRFLPGSSFCMN